MSIQAPGAPPTTQPQEGSAQQPNRPAPPTRSVAAQRRADKRSARGTNAAKVTLVSVVATALALAIAVVGFIGAQNQAAGMSAAVRDTDRVLAVMQLRNAVLTADGAATNAFLVGGLEPVDRRAVYDQAIAEASVLITELADDSQEASQLLAELNTDLTSYTAMVEAARVNNRQGFPVGAAYLDQASTLVREEMLIDLDEVLQISADRAATDFLASNRTYAVIGVLIVGVVGIIACQAVLSGITRRRLNKGIAAGLMVLVVAGVVGGVAGARATSTALDVRDDVYRPTLAVANVGVLAAQARSLESFTLINRGSGAPFEQAYQEAVASAAAHLEDAGDDGVWLQTLLEEWAAEHEKIRALDDDGDWNAAVELAVSDDADSPSAAFAELTVATGAIVDSSGDRLARDLGSAASGATLAAWVLAAAGAIAGVLIWIGTAPRRREYA